MFDLLYTSIDDTNYNLNFVSNNSDYSDKFDFNFIPAEVFEMGINNVDTFINIASMQEMTHNVISKYFKLIQSDK